ncbi:MAG: peptidylprolyl isomerase [Acidobacteria bacterium]|nr:MAG: peptidylprolyl isomerase [Acidobacteriota bacterium]
MCLEENLKRVHLIEAGLGLLCVFFMLQLAACNREGSSGDVMASVNGRKIYRSEVDKYFANQTAGSDQQPTGEQAVSLRLSILDTLIETEILMKRAEKLGLLASDEEVDRKLNEMKSPFTAEQFNQRLAEKKLTVDDFKHELRRSLTREKVLNKEVTSRITITDQDVANYYNAHKAEFNYIEPQYRLSKIMVTGMPNQQVHNLQNSKAQNDADARKKIQMIANRLDSGDEFATLAMGFSEDPETSSNGGDLGLAPESALKNADPVTRDAVLKLKPGQYTPVLPLLNPANHQPYGYMIVKLVSKEPAGQRDLSDPRVQQSFRQQLHDRREQLLKAAYSETLRNEAKITNYYAREVLTNAGTAQ